MSRSRQQQRQRQHQPPRRRCRIGWSRVVVRGATLALASLFLLGGVDGPTGSPLDATGGSVAAQAAVRVVAYNVKHGLGMDSIIDLERIAAVLRPLYADVITLQEIDRGVERSGGEDQAKRLAGMLGMSAHFGPFMPYQGGEYGMAVLTRLPVLDVRNLRLPDGEEPRSALHVQVAAGVERRPVSVVGIHLYRTPEERRAQADSLSRLLDDVDHPVILAGDFNSQRGDVVMNLLEEEGWLVVEKDGDADTFPSDGPEREIDFMLLRPASAFEVVEHRVLEEEVASDHRPVMLVVRMWDDGGADPGLASPGGTR